MKILIAGCGKVGETLAEQLSAEGNDLTIIDSKNSVIEKGVEKLDLMAVRGNCASMDTLEQAGIAAAELLIAVTGSDETNLLTCVTAHAMNPKIHTIARIRDPEYTRQVYEMRDAFGLSLIFNPERQTATEIDRLLKYPGFLKRDTFAKGRLEIVEIRIDEKSPLQNTPLREMQNIVKCRVLIAAVLRDGEAIVPDGRFVLKREDKLFVTATNENLSLLLKNLGIYTHKAKHVTLIGGGKVSFYLANLLTGEGTDVKVIDRDREVCEQFSALVPRADVVCGDGCNLKFLDSEGIANTDALVSLTGSDESNMIISIFGSRYDLPQVITKLARLDDAKVTGALPLGSIVMPRKLCCAGVLQYVRAMKRQQGAATAIHTIADDQFEAIEFPVDESTLHTGEPLKKIKLRPDTLIVGISRGASTEVAGGDSVFRIGDAVIVVVSKENLVLNLNDIFS